MKKITLTLENIVFASQLHAYLRKQLNLPAYYGDNLDALYDCLTEMDEDAEIIVCQQELEKNDYLRRLECVLLDAAEENAHLRVIIK